jgi:uncharacterized protein (TIGR00661 family)
VKIYGKNVLVTPLDWGLGHATRCIPIIKALIINGYDVTVAASGKSIQLLKTEFPEITIVPIPGYSVQYAKSGFALPFKLMLQVPKILRAIRHENQILKKLVKQYQIHWVISDNRFGMYHPQIHCTFITHQLTIMAPYNWMRSLLQRINYNYIQRFNECWVPDMGLNGGIAGILSHPNQFPKVSVSYLGLLCRFNLAVPQQPKYQYDYCFLLSGPEPQRSLLQKMIIEQTENIHAQIIILLGQPEMSSTLIRSKHHILNHASQNDLQQIIQSSRFVIARSGYTSVMELLCLQKKCLFIPTPGQTEQVYLAERLHALKMGLMVPQHSLNLSKHLPMLEQYDFAAIQPEVFTPQKLIDLLPN